jgi:hypothetical protein
VLDELNQPFIVQTIEERADVAFQHPLTFLVSNAVYKASSALCGLLPGR